jgi:uncharacterized protein (TIGR02596 family)
MRTFPFKNSAFSLVELFIVALLLAVMAAFALSTPSTVVKGSHLSQAERLLTDQFKLARQEAITRNHRVEVRLIRFGDPESPGESASDPSTGFYRAIQLFDVLDNGSSAPLDKPQLLPQAIVMSSDEHSTLLSHADLQPPQHAGDHQGANPSLPRGIDRNYEYVSFRFLPDGGTSLNSTNGVTWCATLRRLVDKPDGPKPPPNFVTLQLDPVAGTVQLFRPSM